jgi:murein L,D-transpeptidase YcbB/YkuD
MDAAIYDVSLTDALLRYSSDLLAGRVHPRDVYKDIALPDWTLDVPAALALALKTNSIASYLETLVPAHPAYRRLMTGLGRYRNIAAQGGWSAISAQSPDRSASAVYTRLAIEDSGLHPITKPTAAQLQEAVKRYQVRHGLTPDGKLGPDLVSELNVPVTARIQQINANLERWRWISGEFESRYVAINVAGQTLEFVQDGRVVLNSRVIVGRKGSPTPILRTVAHSLVANPPWDIPADIAADQLLPHLKNNRHYLADHNMVIVNAPDDPRGWNIPWEQVSRTDFPYNIRQMPPYSALGVLMLDSPNEFDVYLHDTPGKRFFRDDDREISNGCVRVEQITALASLALTGNSSAGLATINSAISSRQTREIMLDNPLPIYMLYWTAVADDEGNVGFLPDRYHRDPPLIEALNKATSIANKKPGE